MDSQNSIKNPQDTKWILYQEPLRQIKIKIDWPGREGLAAGLQLAIYMYNL